MKRRSNVKKVSSAVRRLLDLINGRVAKGYDYQLAETSLVIGDGDSTYFSITRMQYKALKELGY